MIRNWFPPLAVFVALMATGCATRSTYDVTVTNRLSGPITVWMTKAKPAGNGQYERGWMPPEAAAVGTVGPATELGGVAVEPGETAHANVTGTIAGVSGGGFERDSRAEPWKPRSAGYSAGPGQYRYRYHKTERPACGCSAWRGRPVGTEIRNPKLE